MVRRSHSLSGQDSTLAQVRAFPGPDLTILQDFQGTNHDDVIIGTDDADSIDGRAGNDTLRGHDGDDVIHGGDDNDYINGNEGNDTLYGGSGTNEVHGGDGDDTIVTDSESDLIYGGTGSNTITGHGATVYTTLGGIDTIESARHWYVDYSQSVEGMTVTDRYHMKDFGIVFSNGTKITDIYDNYQILLGSGDDVFDRNNFRDGSSADAGAGNDRFVLHSSGNRNARLSLLDDGDGSFTLIANSKKLTSSTFTSFEEFDITVSRARESIRIDAAALYHGAHLDLHATSCQALTHLDFSDVDQQVVFAVDATGTGQINGSTIQSSDYDITLNDLGAHVTAFGNLRGGAGDDILTVTAASVVDGNDGNDMLTGTAGASTFSGGAGDDVINAASGDDQITGDDGTDTIDGGGGNDTIDGGTGDDRIDGSGGMDHLAGGAGHNVLNGGDDNDVIVSAPDALDTVDGGAGDDRWSGDFSAERHGLTASWDGTLHLSNGASVVNVEQLSFVRGKGNDHVSIASASAETFTVQAGAGTDTIDYSQAAGPVTVSLAQSGVQHTGGGGAETIGGFENLVGSAFADTLSGTGGDNLLTGGGGADVLTGSGGADSFIFKSLSDFGDVTDVDKMDRLADFTHFENDRIDLSAIDADPDTPKNQAFTFIGGAQFDVGGTGPGEVRYSQSVDGYLLVQGDLNHDGQADFAFLVHGTALVASDLVL